MKRIPLTLVSCILLLGLGLRYPLAEATADSQCDKQSVTPPMGVEAQSVATLCADRKGVRAKIKAKRLTPGNAYTFWFAYVDNPALCVGGGPGVCTPEDFGAGNPMANPLGVFGRLDSTVAHKNGKALFSGRIGGLRLSSGSLVLLILYSHGPADTSDNRSRARQLLTPEDPPAGMPGLGNVVDGPGFTPNAIAVFNIP